MICQRGGLFDIFSLTQNSTREPWTCPSCSKPARPALQFARPYDSCERENHCRLPAKYGYDKRNPLKPEVWN